MTDLEISALKYSVDSLNSKLERLGKKIDDMDSRLSGIDDWVRMFWVKSLAIGAIVLTYVLTIIAGITHGQAN